MPYATKLFHNAVILTMDERDTVASAIALDGERILAVGSRADVEPFVGPETECRDMGGKTIMPGFYDAHGHILLTASMLDWKTSTRRPSGPAAPWRIALPSCASAPRPRPPGNGCLPMASTIRSCGKSFFRAVWNWMP